jgi:hypothetical protein
MTYPLAVPFAGSTDTAVTATFWIALEKQLSILGHDILL